jgi:hypothetical protein
MIKTSLQVLHTKRLAKSKNQPKTKNQDDGVISHDGKN